MNKMNKLHFLEAAVKDYKKLDGSQLVFVDKGLDRIALLGMHVGSRLHGSLEGCRKLKNRKMGSSKGIEIINIVAIGERCRNKVYQTALERFKAEKN